ncbi:MAG: hypothetical protein IJ064_03230 [Bacteroidaceae bacterium]|nr:hypothetical protein [Bacteroidaceae bacterium]
MKKTILTFALFMGVANFQFSTFNFQLGTAQAQDFLFEFADEHGTVIPDGTVLTITKAEVAADGSGDVVMDAGVYAKNVDGDADQLLRINYEVLNKDNGDLEICFPKECIMVRQDKGTTIPGTLNGTLHSIATEWFPLDYGTCTVKIRLESVVKTIGDNYTVTDDGPCITLKFVYADPSHVDATGAALPTPVEYYSLSGQRLPSTYRGIAVVRLSDGRVEKRILR